MLVDRYGKNVQDYEIFKAGRVTCNYYNSQWLKGTVNLEFSPGTNYYAIVSMVYVNGSAITQTNSIGWEFQNNSLVIWPQGNYVSGHLLDVSYQIVKAI